MFANARLRLRQSVGIVVSDGMVEFFKANVRQSLKLKMNGEGITTLLQQFDGIQSLSDIGAQYADIDIEQLQALASLLHEHYVLIEQDVPYPITLVKQEYRIVNLLEDYCHSSSAVLAAIERLHRSRVMIIGLGAVGSWIALYLAKAGVGSLTLVDNDEVALSNLHRQHFFEADIGQNKAARLAKQLSAARPDIHVDIVSARLQEGFFEQYSFSGHNLIINCADEPNVDTTSRIVAGYAMAHDIPHIVGGGYNLHLTLIGQSIVPRRTACFECFNTALAKLNDVELCNVKKLHRESRKLGSFSPLSSIAATLASLDAFKILIGRYDLLQNSNKRIEFNIRKHQFSVIDIPQNPHCTWCGHE